MTVYNVTAIQGDDDDATVTVERRTVRWCFTHNRDIAFDEDSRSAIRCQEGTYQAWRYDYVNYVNDTSKACDIDDMVPVRASAEG